MVNKPAVAASRIADGHGLEKRLARGQGFGVTMNLFKLPTWADKEHIYAVVETPRGSTCKLDFDPKLKVFTLAKPLMTGLTYPYDWGFIPSTKADDGDPLDVLISWLGSTSSIERGSAR